MKKVFLLVFILFLFILPLTLFSIETGNIAGKVYIQKTEKPLFQANVYVEDLKTGMLTKEDGSFIMKNIPVGIHTVTVSFMGYEKLSEEVEVKPNLTTTVIFSLRMKPIGIAGITVTATRAIKRETPIAFTDIEMAEISDKYTTQDMPQLLEDVPGLFSSTTGIGDAQITMRGFEADKIQVLINGIPVNDPESQNVYWSNWTGLSSNVKSVQVQKGSGSSLYGSGAFGGSLNIETIGSIPNREFTFRSSFGGYSTEGDVADGKGEITDYNPINYNALFRYNSGNLYGGKFNYNVMLERKAGDYYLAGTDYNGYSFGLETQNIIGPHKINLSFIGAPQYHNQVYFKSDRNLMETLGREYNRNNHEYQENYYFKPQLSLRDEWKISDKQLLMTNVFVTKGNGGGKYLSQDNFDVETGDISFKEIHSANEENITFGRHARYIYQITDSTIIFDGYNPSDSNYYGYPTYNGKIITSGADFFSSPDRYDYSWRNNSISDHSQLGLNTYYQHDINPMLKLVVGGELRRWVADHYRKTENFRHFNPEFPDSVETYDEIQRQYDETSTVTNLSGFARFSIKPIKNINIMIDGQLASYNSKVEENPIEIYDLGTGEPTGYYFYSTKEIKDDDGNLKFTKDDYKKTYNFFSPKFGINYNISKYFNIMTNYSISYKEPRTMEWYSGYDGPDGNQRYTQNLVGEDASGYYEYSEETFYGELKPEKINTMEFGVGYDGIIFDVNANYYISDYIDKIEYVEIPITNYYYDEQNDSIYTVQRDENLTLNAGKAQHQGLELSTSVNYADFDFSSSLTLARFRWTKMNIEEIFGISAEEMEGKVVPFSPEKMANGSIGYTLQGLPMDGRLRIGFTAKYWDDYYANYTNEYDCIEDLDGDFIADTTSVKSTKLPHFLEFGSNIKYAFKIGNKDAFIRLDLNNITNRKDNYSSANVNKDYNRGYYNEEGEFVDDYLTDNDYMYVTPAPLFNIFLTFEIKF